MPHPAQCVLLTPKRVGQPDANGIEQRLRGVLSSGGCQIHEADQLLQALAELCLLQRTLDIRRAHNDQPASSRPHDGLTLVVVEPSRWPQLDDMVAAARRFVPGATLWSFAAGRLHPLQPGPSPDYPPTPPTPTRTGPPDPDSVEPPDITTEEIAMLLDDQDSEGSPS